MWRRSAPLPALLLVPVLLASRGAAPPPPTLSAPTAPPEALKGRWDITVRTSEGARPSWLELWQSGGEQLVGRFVGVVGSARPVSRVELNGTALRFAIPRQWEEGAGELVVEGQLQGAQLEGTMTFPDGRRYNWSGVRAPALRRTSRAAWGAPITLLRQGDLGGWRAVGGSGENQWNVAGGVLHSPRSGVNLVTERTFRDFKLHLEFRYPRGSNSGVYLRGRHEVQIEDDERGTQGSEQFAGVYGFIPASENASRGPGEWQTYDITLVGRMLTVVANGRTVICNQEVPGITGGALDSDEGAPGPIMLQGDHGPIEYRNIVLTPAR